MSTAARIDELRKKFDENPRRYFSSLANGLRKGGNLTEAIALCREFLPRQPEHMSGYIVYGQALYESGEMFEARLIFTQALALDPENLKALEHLGDIAQWEGDTSAARRWYERVLEGDPSNDDVATHLATLSIPVHEGAVAGIAIEGERAAESTLADFWVVDGEVAVPVGEAATLQTVEEGLVAPEWLDTTTIATGVVYPPTVAPMFTASRIPDAVMAFGMEQGDPVMPPSLVDDEASNRLRSQAPEQLPMSMDDTSDASFAKVMDNDPLSAFVTETMGELLVSQGFTARAITVYDELVRRRPYDPLLTARLAELREQLADGLATLEPLIPTSVTPAPVLDRAGFADLPSSVHTPTAMPLQARERFARLATRRVTHRAPVRALTGEHAPEQGLASLFGSSAVDDDLAARTLAAAFTSVDERFPSSTDLSFEETMLGLPERSTTPWRSSTSTSAPTAPTPMADAPSGAFPIDRVFREPATGSFPPVSDGAGSTADGSRATPTSTSSGRPPGVSDDLAQFSAWLKGLSPS